MSDRIACPACEYEFDPAGGLKCPRCGATLSCSGVSCAQCNACTGAFDRLRRTLTDRLRDGDAESNDERDDRDRRDALEGENDSRSEGSRRREHRRINQR